MILSKLVQELQEYLNTFGDCEISYLQLGARLLAMLIENNNFKLSKLKGDSNDYWRSTRSEE